MGRSFLLALWIVFQFLKGEDDRPRKGQAAVADKDGVSAHGNDKLLSVAAPRTVIFYQKEGNRPIRLQLTGLHKAHEDGTDILFIGLHEGLLLSD